MNKIEILKKIKSSHKAIKDLNPSLFNDIDFVKELINIQPMFLNNLPQNIKDNKELVLLSVEKKGVTLMFASDRLKDDREVVLKSLSIDSFAFKYVSERLRDDIDVLSLAMRYSSGELHYASERLKNDVNFFKFYLKKDLTIVKNIGVSLKKNKDIASYVLKQNGKLLNFFDDVIKNDFDLVLLAVKNNGEAIDYASKILKYNLIILDEAIKSSGKAIAYVPYFFKNKEEFVFRAINYNPSAYNLIEHEFKNNKILAKKGLFVCPKVFLDLSEENRDDIELIKISIKGGISPYFLFKALTLETIKNNEKLTIILEEFEYVNTLLCDINKTYSYDSGWSKVLKNKTYNNIFTKKYYNQNFIDVLKENSLLLNELLLEYKKQEIEKLIAKSDKKSKVLKY